MMWSLPDRLPTNLFRYVFAVSWRHQIALVALTVITFLLEIVPLEIQRRVVNNLVKERPFQLVIVLCAAYACAVLIQGATKLGLNIYRGWVGENATRDLPRHVIGYSRTAQAVEPGAEARGIGAAMIVAEVEPIGGFVGSSLSEPLLQGGIMLSILAYIVHLDRWMAAAAFALFLPQLVRRFQNNAPMGSCCIVDFVAPSVDHWLAIDVGDEGDQAFLEFVFAADADVAQHRTRQLGEEALDEIEP